MNIMGITLILIGAVNGLLVFYGYFGIPHFIPKSKAVEVFWNTFNCTGQFERQFQVTVELIHIVNSTRQYHVDETNMQDMALASEYVKNGFKENEYVWKVHGDCQITNTGGIRSDVHYVDAKTGELLG